MPTIAYSALLQILYTKSYPHPLINAAQLITGRGGWPLNALAMPDGKPFYAGTYFPKKEWIKMLEYFIDLIVVESNNIQSASFTIKGMSCKACETEVNNELHKVSGVIDAQTFYDKGTSIVKYLIRQYQSLNKNTGC
jgi:copper chaperone CopZ